MRTHTMFATVVVLLLCLGLSVCDRCDTAPGVNGCSVPGDRLSFVRDVFESDCNKHDVCYSCGTNRGVSRRQCDLKFRNNIEQTCRTDGRVRQKWCNRITRSAYAAVRMFGNRRYIRTSPDWCFESWVSQCLD